MIKALWEKVVHSFQWIIRKFKRSKEDGLKKLRHHEKWQVNQGWYNIFLTTRSRKKARKNKYKMKKAYGL